MASESYTLRVTRVANGWIVEPVISHVGRTPSQDIMIVPEGEDLSGYIAAQITSQKLMTDEKREALMVKTHTGMYGNQVLSGTVTAATAHAGYIDQQKLYNTYANQQRAIDTMIGINQSLGLYSDPQK
jgi:hypothetical protein